VLTRNGKKVILIVALVIVMAAGAVIGYFTYTRNQEEMTGKVVTANSTDQMASMIAEYRKLIASIEIEVPEPPYVSPIDFETLWQQNSDIIAWITIPDTNIDYPIVQTDNNDQYLHVDLDGKKSVYGTIFLDCDSESDLSGYHNILYGHNMKNGSMFQNVVKYKQEDFFNSHRDIYIYTPEREIHLRTIAALYTDASGEKRRTKFATDEEFMKYVDKLTSGCKYRQMPEENITTLYSLVTCSYEFHDARTILYAYEF